MPWWVQTALGIALLVTLTLLLLTNKTDPGALKTSDQQGGQTASSPGCPPYLFFNPIFIAFPPWASAGAIKRLQQD